MTAKVKSKLALAGAFLGLALVVSVGLGLLLYEPKPGEGRWETAMVAIFLAPYAVALAAAFVESDVVRGGFLLAAGLASLTWTLLLLTLGLAVLPATLLLLIAAGRTLAKAGLPRGTALALAAAGLGGAVLLAAAFFALYTQRDDRSWETLRFPDGRVETRLTGAGVGGSADASRGVGTLIAGGGISDVVTAREAAQGLAFTAGGLLFLFLSTAALGRQPHRRSGAPTVA
jgi:hypothetical protein